MDNENEVAPRIREGNFKLEKPAEQIRTEDFLTGG
jgi:hypothetical protein